jgi:hypothetical protein
MSDEGSLRESGQGLSAERMARNEAIFRHANEGIRKSAEEYDVRNRVPFVCECADPNCRVFVPMALDEYSQVRRDPRHFLIAPGHEDAGDDWGEIVARQDGFVTVAKLGRAGEVAEQLEGVSDPASALPDDAAEPER